MNGGAFARPNFDNLMQTIQPGLSQDFVDYPMKKVKDINGYNPYYGSDGGNRNEMPTQRQYMPNFLPRINQRS